MSQAPVGTETEQKPSAARRYFIVLLVGLVLGMAAGIFAWREFTKKTLLEAWPDATMTVIAIHNGELKKKLDSNMCSSSDVLPHLKTLRQMASDLEPGFTEFSGDASFARHAANFRGVLDSALSVPPASCESLKQVTSEIGGQCKACHDDFKS